MAEEMRVGAENRNAASIMRAANQIDLRRRSRPGETIIQAVLFSCGLVSILTTVGIVLVLLNEAIAFFALPEVSLGDFLTKTQWQPSIGQFGILSLLNATLSFQRLLIAK